MYVCTYVCMYVCTYVRSSVTLAYVRGSPSCCASLVYLEDKLFCGGIVLQSVASQRAGL